MLLFALVLTLSFMGLSGCPSPATAPVTSGGQTVSPTTSPAKTGSKSGIPLTINTNWSLTDAYIIVDYQGEVSYLVNPQTLMAYGGSPLSHYTWSKPTGGRFPPIGTMVDPNGVFRGTGGALAEGTYTFDVEVSDGSRTATAAFTIKVEKIDLVENPLQASAPLALFQQALGMPTIPLADGIAGQPYAASLYVMGGEPPYSWFVDPAYQKDLVLSGLTIDMAGGVVRGTISPNMSGQTIKFRVAVQDNTGSTAESEPGYQIYTINVK
jgi:hypothetical protein